MDMNELTPQKLEDIFEGRDSKFKAEWGQIKKEFIDLGLTNLLKEGLSGWTFQVVYTKMTEMSDDEIFDHMIDEI